MSTKELAIQSLRELPEDVSWDDIEERIRLLRAIDQGRRDIKDGRVVAHREVKQLLREWLTA